MVRILQADKIEVVYDDGGEPQYLRVADRGRVLDFEWGLAKKMAGTVRKGPLRDRVTQSNQQ